MIRTMVRVVAVDLDGTLLRDDGTVSPRTVQAVRDCHARGITVLPVTARSPAETAPVAAATGTTGAAICCLGAVVYDLAGAAVRQTRPLAAAGARALVAAVRRAVPTAAFGWVGAAGTGREPGYPLRRPIPDLRIGPIDGHLADPVWHLFVRDSHRRPLPATLIRAAGGGLAEISYHDPGLIDFTAPGVTKGSTLARWCAARGITAAEVAAIGDGTIDLPMLAWAATRAAVANALPEVRAAVDHVVPDNNSDGVAVFLERLLRDSGTRPAAR
jgi:hydroxymethylpyrimidine pyrophosphatase-like HAD family hydrolase